jgi:predicted GTPase
MHPVNFEGAVVINKPDNMTNEQCTALWAKFGFGKLHQIFQANGIAEIPPAIYAGVDSEKFPFYMTAWQFNK